MVGTEARRRHTEDKRPCMMMDRVFDVVSEAQLLDDGGFEHSIYSQVSLSLPPPLTLAQTAGLSKFLAGIFRHAVSRPGI
jgi:hypothetical protein